MADWTFVDNGKVLGSWQSSNVERRAMAGGPTVRRCFVQVQVRAGRGTPGGVSVQVLGIHGTDDYLRLAGYLDSVSIVRRVVPVSANPTDWSWTWS